MNYALIENGIVTNVIWLYSGNEKEFPNAVALKDVPAGIGDTYEDGVFYRNGEKVLTALEVVKAELSEANATIAELDAALLDATYENIVGGVE